MNMAHSFFNIADPLFKPFYNTTHLSEMLAGFIVSIQIIGRPLWTEVAREIPRQAPGDLSISTSKGPEAFCTASETGKQKNKDK